MVIREMQIEDIEAVEAVDKACFSVPWQQTAFLSFLMREGTVFLVAEEDNEIIGYLGIATAYDESDVLKIVVSQEHRRKGAAGALLENAFDKIRAMGVKKNYLEVRVSNAPAISLYRKYGYTDVGIRRNYYTKPVEDALVMEKDI